MLQHPVCPRPYLSQPQSRSLWPCPQPWSRPAPPCTRQVLATWRWASWTLTSSWCWARAALERWGRQAGRWNVIFSTHNLIQQPKRLKITRFIPGFKESPLWSWPLSGLSFNSLENSNAEPPWTIYICIFFFTSRLITSPFAKKIPLTLRYRPLMKGEGRYSNYIFARLCMSVFLCLLSKYLMDRWMDFM